MIRGRRDRAMEAYRRILDDDPADPAALSMVLGDLRREGEAEQVVELANRALGAMPDNFFALDGLAWARIERHEYAEAKTAVQLAMRSLDALGPSQPFGPTAKFALAVVRILGRIPGLRHRVPCVPSPDGIIAAAARGHAEWRRWASEYLAWYERTHGRDG